MRCITGCTISCHRCDDALQQNEVTNIFEDDFAFLGDDDGGNGNRKENTISEYQSFTDLQHSKGRIVSAIHWLPHRKVRPDCQKVSQQPLVTLLARLLP